MTMRRWHCWLEANRLRIDGYLKSTGYRLLGFSTELLGSRVSLLDKLRSSRPEWLKHCSGSFIIPEVFLSTFNIPALHRLCFAVTTAL